MSSRQITKLVITLLAAAYFVNCLLFPAKDHYIYFINIVIHEAGHWIFAFLGEFMSFLGGSLLQILVPAIFCAYFFLHNKNFSGSLLLFWLGQNFVDVSVYAGDAVKMALPLLGGDASTHDWNWLLVRLGWLPHTALVAGTLKTIGAAIIILAIILCFKQALQAENKIIE